LAASISGHDVTTIEGLADQGSLDPIQEAFVEKDASQCGYCTPGMIMAAKGLLLRSSDPTDEEVKDALSGNICRCTGYAGIHRAVKAAAVKHRR
jgi:carbon-monoxide dehydrogenase small subunit